MSSELRESRQTDASIDRRGLMKGLLAGSAAVALAGQGTAFAASAVKPPFKGLYPIGFTPVSPDNKIDYDALAGQVRFLQKGRVPGIAWPQIASGWASLSPEERMTGTEALTAAAKGAGTAVIIGIQDPDFAAVGRYAKHAEKAGADGLMCISPEGVSDEAKLLDYYQQVGKMTKLPLFAQAVGDMSIDVLVKMYETIPTLKYVKDEAGEPLLRVEELRKRTNNGMQVFSGRGVRTMVTEMERGVIGHCPHVSLADVFQSAWEAWHDGDKAAAFQRFGAISAVSTMFSLGSPNVLIARGVFKPGTKARSNPRPAGATGGGGAPAYMPASSPEEIARILKDYMTPYMRA